MGNEPKGDRYMVELSFNPMFGPQWALKKGLLRITWESVPILQMRKLRLRGFT